MACEDEHMACIVKPQVCRAADTLSDACLLRRAALQLHMLYLTWSNC